MRRLVTASSLHRAHACQHPWTSGLEWVDRQNASGRLGHAFHAAAERASLLEEVHIDGIALEFSLQPAQIRRLGAMFRAWEAWFATRRVDHGEWSFERKIAYDPVSETSRWLSSPSARDYSEARPNEVCGTADVIVYSGDEPDRRATVSDYKTGVWVDHPRDSDQMRFLSLAVARLCGLSSVLAEIIRVTEEGVHVVAHRFHLGELTEIATEMVDLHYRMEMPVGANPGLEQCRFCPVGNSCSDAIRKDLQNAHP